MSENIQLVLICFFTPFMSLVIMFWVLTHYNSKNGSLAEVRLTLPPEILLRIMAVFLIAVITFVLTYQKVMEMSVASAILSSIVTGVIASYRGEKKE